MHTCVKSVGVKASSSDTSLRRLRLENCRSYMRARCRACFTPSPGRRQHRRRLVRLPLLDILRHGVAEARLVAVHRVQVAVVPARRMAKPMSACRAHNGRETLTRLKVGQKTRRLPCFRINQIGQASCIMSIVR